MDVKKEITRIEDSLKVMFIENECLDVGYYAIAYKDGKVSCFFHCDGGDEKLREWMTNARSYSVQSYASRFISTYTNKRYLYRISPDTFYRLGRTAKHYKRDIQIYQSFGKLFDIYYHEDIFDSNITIRTVECFDINSIKATQIKINGI